MSEALQTPIGPVTDGDDRTEVPVKARKKAAKAARKPSANGAAHWNSRKATFNYREDGRLIKMQVRVLEALTKFTKPVDIEKLAEKVGVPDPRVVRWAMGQVHPEKLAHGRDPHSLLGRGLVKQVILDVSGKEEACYTINRSGEAALRKAEKEAAKKKE